MTRVARDGIIGDVELLSRFGGAAIVRSETLRFVVPGPPQPCQRARVFVRKGTNRISSAVPKETRAYENKVRDCAQIAVNLARWRIEEGVRYRFAVKVWRDADRGDGDNFAKALSDPLTGLVWKDDRYIKVWHVELGIDRKNPRAEVEIERLWEAA